MKVFQINSVIHYGSTGRIARNLYDYLVSQGDECIIAFGRGDFSPDYNTVKIGTKLGQIVHIIYSRLTDRHGFASKMATKKLIKEIEEYNPDVIQLHNLHGYYVNIEILFSYLSKKDIPVVWLLHDQWAVSGHSANFNLNADGTLPTKLISKQELNNYPKTIGISQFEKNLEHKKELFTSVNNMTIITPSKWLAEIMNKTFLNKYKIKTIYNGVDTDIFFIDNSKRKKLRENWNADNKIIILGIASVWNERKGLHDFITLSKFLPIEEYQIVLVGVNNKIKADLPDNIITIERTNSVDELRMIYNATDIFVNPTYYDNFPTVNIEALACGVPVITYQTGGSPESIDKYTGTVIPQGNIFEMIETIKKRNKRDAFTTSKCRERALKYFSHDTVYHRYYNLYKNIIH